MTARRLSGALALTGLLAGTGCFVSISTTSVRTGDRLPAREAAAIVKGMAAREVLDALGPPTAVLRGGQVATVAGFYARRQGSVEVSAAILLARFPPGTDLAPRDLLYLYEAPCLKTRCTWSGFFLASPGGAGGDSHSAGWRTQTVERLLVLVDGERRTVRAVARVTEGGKETVAW